MGDFDCKKIEWKNLDLHEERELWKNKFLECVEESFLHQYVMEYTRARGSDTPSILDLIFTYKSLEIKKTFGVMPYFGKVIMLCLNLNFWSVKKSICNLRRNQNPREVQGW